MDRYYKSKLAGGEDTAAELADVAVPQVLARFPVKLWWFGTRPTPYEPHVWQYVFHGAHHLNGRLRRYRHLVAGRRGGKTLSAAWEVLYYALFPNEFHKDAHGLDRNRPLWIWALAKDYQAGRPSLRTFLNVLADAGLVKDRDFSYNKQQQTFEFFSSGSVVEFKTASDPQSLRGAGLDILWIDEAAFVPNNEAWNVVYSALTQTQGIVITTTTPWGENWFYEEFFTGEALGDHDQFRVEYTSIDNPYFPQEEWERAKRMLHPVVFAQEHLASFKAMHGVALNGEWLKYYVFGNPDTRTDDISVPREGDKYQLKLYMGIDPAVSLSDSADDFAMALIGISDEGQVFLLDTYLGHIAFPDQIDKIAEWHLKWRPEIIGVESNAFQRALEQQASRLPGIPNVVPVFAKGKKEERILSMSPLFKTGRVRIRKNQGDFIDQWVAFDPEKKNQRDDLLDAVEIALGVAGILLPMSPHVEHFDTDPSLDAAAQEYIRNLKKAQQPYDPDLGEMA